MWAIIKITSDQIYVEKMQPTPLAAALNQQVHSTPRKYVLRREEDVDKWGGRRANMKGRRGTPIFPNQTVGPRATTFLQWHFSMADSVGSFSLPEMLREIKFYKLKHEWHRTLFSLKKKVYLDSH